MSTVPPSATYGDLNRDEDGASIGAQSMYEVYATRMGMVGGKKAFVEIVAPLLRAFYEQRSKLDAPVSEIEAIPRYYVLVTGDPGQKFAYAIDDQSGFVESPDGAWMRAHDVMKARSAPSARVPNDDIPLRCEVVDGAIQFTIGAKVLAFATDNCPTLYDHENDRGRYRVTDPAVFAKAVERELNHESEGGSTPLTRMLDEAVDDAINQGAEGVVENE